MAEVKRATLDRYMALLEATYLVRLIPAWAGDPAREYAKRPKPVITDSGLACHLPGADEQRLLRDPDLLGSLLEAFVACELVRQESFSDARVRISHFRSTSADFRGLRAFAERTGERFVRGVLLHTGSSSAPFGDDLWALPVGEIW